MSAPVHARLAVASNFSATTAQLINAFNNEQNQQNQFEISASFGSSGKLFAQIMNGAPYHAFLSADEDRVHRLLQRGHGIEGSDFIYARGQLALFSIKPELFPLNETALSKARVVALANPKLAPYGFSAQHYLTHHVNRHHVNWPNASATPYKVILGENISQTFQFVVSGNADVGLVAYSQLLASQQPKERWQRIALNQYPPINQKAVLTVTGKSNPAAHAFLAFLRSQRAINIIQQSGYAVGNPLFE